MKIIFIILCIISTVFQFYSEEALSYSTYYEKTPVGWHWNNNLENANPKIEKPKPNQNKSDSDNNPIKQMDRIHHLLAYYKDKAVLNPTVENIREYFIVQNMMMKQSSLFAENWKKTMLLYPQFDYGISHPTDSAISQISQSHLHDKKAAVAKLMAHQFGMLFFYEGKNSLSAAMENTVSQFSHFYGFSVIAVSLDHVVIQGGMPSQMDNGQAAALGVKASPAVVLVDPKTGAHTILTYGYASINELLTDCYNVYTGLSS